MASHYTIDADTDLNGYCESLGQRARAASRLLQTVPGQRKDHWLHLLAREVEAHHADILLANERDLAGADQAGFGSALRDRLRLTPDRLAEAAAGLRAVAALPNPVGRVLDSSIRPNGLQVQKVAVPLGVIFFIYEARPSVTLDASALCVKSGNALILRGGKEAHHSNAALQRLIESTLHQAELPPDTVQMVRTTNREAVGRLLQLAAHIDLVIPRGGEGLIRRVAADARMPVLKHYKGNCHVYVDSSADLDMAERILINAKCQRPGVCNAAESLLVHADVAESFLPRAAVALGSRGVEMRGCDKTRRIVPVALPATEEDFAAEYLELILSIKVVDNLEEAIEHIGRYGSGHTETIVTRDLASARRFTVAIDSSAVLVNASTRFNDGYELGLGAEIGISTDKLHARGPCGLLELCSYKYILFGDGQVRE
jgi:glutamate-5-semialdehyde dehydrogenase